MVHSTISLHDMRERDEFCREQGRVFREQKKELIIAAERLVLRTIDFDLDVQLPYNKTLVAALKRLSKEKFTGFRLPELTKVAWCLVDEVLTTSLCLQYKPQYIAAGLSLSVLRF
ncbi:putative cyclin [Rosa chinensis]|uniref:Putative cyclin n=1 Tax=Rosa chinensis TaxID=74649 RepID=A0A2P6RAY8_ROSCH|nr:putative cyclin [Rosa chinensis]